MSHDAWLESLRRAAGDPIRTLGRVLVGPITLFFDSGGYHNTSGHAVAGTVLSPGAEEATEVCDYEIGTGASGAAIYERAVVSTSDGTWDRVAFGRQNDVYVSVSARLPGASRRSRSRSSLRPPRRGTPRRQRGVPATTTTNATVRSATNAHWKGATL